MAHRDINNIDKTILDNFYKLVYSQAHVRITAASSTYKILSTFKKSSPTKFNDNLNYCINRLVAGLASPRAMARQGYATLLLELLKSYQVSTERLFSIANDKYGQVSRETSQYNLIAYFLLIAIILNSGNLEKLKANSKYVEKIYVLLKQLSTKKSYMACPITRLLIDQYDVFSDHLLGDVSPKVASGSPADIILSVITRNEDSARKLSNVLELTRSIHQDTKIVFVKHVVSMLLRALEVDLSAPPKMREDAIRQITNLVRQPRMVEDHEFISAVAKNFFSNYLCLSRKEYKSYYHALLDHLISICNASQRVVHLQTIVDCYQPKSKSPSLEHVKRLVQNSGESKQLYPISSLCLLYGLQIIEHEFDCQTQLDELAHACKEALKGGPWADVLTDQILAILSATDCKPWMRKLCSSVFGSLIPHISHTSIELICDALKSTDHDEDEDEDEGMDCPETDGTDVSDSEDMDCSETEDMEHSKSESLISTEHQSIKSDESEEEYLDDEHMLQLDSHLVEMFKLRRKSKDESAFKLRCLDLVDKILKNKSKDAEIIKTILTTIGPMARQSGQASERLKKMLAKHKCLKIPRSS